MIWSTFETRDKGLVFLLFPASELVPISLLWNADSVKRGTHRDPQRHTQRHTARDTDQRYQQGPQSETEAWSCTENKLGANGSTQALGVDLPTQQAVP